MKKLLIISILLGSIILAGCSNNKEINQTSNEPDVINATTSWLGGSLSRETSIVGDIKYGIETMPINDEAAKSSLGYYFNSAGDTLIAGCNDGYEMTQCKGYSDKDNVMNNDNSLCRLLNEDLDFMRTSMIIECSKM